MPPLLSESKNNKSTTDTRASENNLNYKGKTEQAGCRPAHADGSTQHNLFTPVKI